MRVIELESEAPAVKALGSLFKLTEVFLWDDASMETRERAPFRELADNTDETRSDAFLTTTDCSPLPEDVELVEKMSALGLPLSFQTNKERSGMIGGKRKGMKKKQLHDHEGSVDSPQDLIEVSEVEVESTAVFHDETGDYLCCTSMLGQTELPYSGIPVDINKTPCLTGEEEDLAYLSARSTCDAVEEQLCDGVSCILSNYTLDCGSEHSSVISREDMKTASPCNSAAETSPGSIMVKGDIDHHKKGQDDGSVEFACLEGSLLVDGDSGRKKFISDSCIAQPQGPDVVAYSQSSEVIDSEGNDNQYNGAFGDWTSYWDSFYMRCYFYNMKTHESTWDPPPGMEHLAYHELNEKSGEMITEIAEMHFQRAVSSDHGKPLDHCGLECDSDSFGESKNGDKSLDQPLSEASEGFELAGDNFLDLMTTTSLNADSEQLIENGSIHRRGRIDLQRTNICSTEEPEWYDLQGNSENITCGEVIQEKWPVEDAFQPSDATRIDLQRIYEYSTQEPEWCDLQGNSENITGCEGIQAKWNDADVFQPSDAISFSGALIRALSEGNGDGSMLLGTMDPATEKLETEQNFGIRKMRKKAKKRSRLNRNLSCDTGGLPFQGIFQEFSPLICKYWCQRYLLFSRFDEGIKMDEEGWFSVTPESIARHHALRCGAGIIVDFFTGVGGNAIQFAQRSKHVIAIDIDANKIDYAQHNATIYAVEDRIDFIRGDSFLLAPKLKADTVFLSPPWGGPDYAKVTTYDINTMLKPRDGHTLFNVARGIASKVVMFLPRNVDLNQLAELSLSSNPPWFLEVEKNYLNGKLKAITAYFTDTSV